MNNRTSDASRTPPTEWDYPDPAALDRRMKSAVLEFAPDADLEMMELVFNIFRVTYRLQQDVETNVHRPSGLTWAAFRLLFTIRHAGPLTPLELAQLFSVSQASISSVINTLERYGLVSREPAPNDGRSILVTLTHQGDAVAAELFRRHNAREIEWGSALTKRERQTLVRLLEKLLAHRPEPPAERAERLPELPPAVERKRKKRR
jgi:DNA-binding MarR family transcriptional regulator